MGSGQSITWHLNADSPSGTGEKVILSDPIDGVDPDAFWKALRERMLSREPGQYEKAYEAKEQPDGSILMVTTYDMSLLLGAGAEVKSHVVGSINGDTGLLLSYGNDKLEESSKLNTNKLKVHRDPFRIEWYSEEHPIRRSGPLVLGALKAILTAMGLETVQAQCEVDSISEPGKKAVVTDPIEGTKYDTAASFIEAMKECSLANGGVLQPDGSVAEENSKFFGMFVTYRKHVPDPDNCQIITTEYGTDSTMTEVVGETFLKVHQNPLRIETWTDSFGGVRAKEPQKKIIEEIVQGVFKKMSEG